MAKVRLRMLGSLAIAVGLTVTGCSAGGSGDQNSNPEQQETVKPRATFNPTGGAGDNKAYFDQTLTDLLAANEKADSRAMVNALVEAGFDKSQMEVTFDKTSIGLDVDYIMVSVKMPDGICLMGERGTRGYSSTVANPMSTGKCMIGETQPIDW